VGRRPWIAEIRYIDWAVARAQDLRFVCGPVSGVIMVDDHPEIFMEPAQASQWIAISSWEGEGVDGELEWVSSPGATHAPRMRDPMSC